MGRKEKTMKILIAFGTRPEAIKMAPVIKSLKAAPNLEIEVCLTGQHLEMLDQVMDVFELSSDYNLQVMLAGQSLAELTGKILKGMDEILDRSKPDRILVHGDTTTALACALSAYYKQIPVAHVEAGLRTHNRYSPWPEELNRKMVGSLADLHFAPTESARQNLLSERVDPNQIHVTGNTVVDALLDAKVKVEKNPSIGKALLDKYSFLAEKFILVTGHRRENYGQGFANICSALRDISEKSDHRIVYPVHLNPNVKGPVEEILGDCERVHLIEPMGYLDFVWMMANCRMILTDSGGIQEEAPSLNKPVLVMRDTTERQDAVDAGTVRLVGTNADEIVAQCLKLINNPEEYNSIADLPNPFGRGDSAQQIRKILESQIV